MRIKSFPFHKLLFNQLVPIQFSSKILLHPYNTIGKKLMKNSDFSLNTYSLGIERTKIYPCE